MPFLRLSTKEIVTRKGRRRSVIVFQGREREKEKSV